MGRTDPTRLHLRRAGLVAPHRGAHPAGLAVARPAERGPGPVEGSASPVLRPISLPDALDECWARFDHALRPLHQAGKLGVVVLQYPGWFSPRAEAWQELGSVQARLPDYHLAVELRSPKWFEGDACEGTLEGLEAPELALVCIDGPAAGPRASPGVAAATADVAVVRFRRPPRGRGGVLDGSLPLRRTELGEWVPRLTQLASSAQAVHVLLDNCWGSDAVDNAAELAALLRW